MKKNRKKNDARLDRKAQEIAMRIENRLYASQENEIRINSIRFKLMCGCNKYIEQKVKEYIVANPNLKLMKQKFKYYFFCGRIIIRKKMYIIKYWLLKRGNPILNY